MVAPMKTKIPPPIVLLIWVSIMWLIANFTSSWKFIFPAQQTISITLLALGVLIDVTAIVSFLKARTTVNPVSPEKASRLVTTGMFRFSRNPMYLGMLLVLFAWFLYLGSLLNLVAIFLFYLFISTFQIEPEEQAMLKLFGDAYQDYCTKVRRWI